MIRVPPPNEKLTEIIRKIGVKKLISIEINPYLPVDYQLIAKIAPNFCSVIWIARPNDSKNPRMLNPLIVSKELIRRGYTVLVHIPGIFYSRHEMKNILTILKEYGIRNIFAMRGGGPWLKIKNADFSLAQIFIEFIRDEFRGYFDIIIAGFPNVHPASNSMEQEMFFLRNKIVSGANIILTQACMTPERYLNYKKICTLYAIDIPIIYGVLLLRSWNDFVRIKKMSLLRDWPVMKKALDAKRKKQGRQFAREWTKYIIKEILDDEETVGVHIFSQNYLELTKNIIVECNASNKKAYLKRSI